jgi:hypothetical protein
MGFVQKLIYEREKVYQEKDKAKLQFHQDSETVNSTKIKHDKTIDQKAKDKLKRQWHQYILDMNNSKVTFI